MSKIITSKDKGIIYYFSGTGNSLFVAKEYQKLFLEKKIITELSDIVDIDVVSSQSKYDFIIISFPVYAWMPPKIVVDFVKRLPVVEHKPVYIFSTCRHSSGYSLDYLKKIFIKKGYEVNYTQEYIMPQNIFLKKQENAEQVIKKAVKKIKDDFTKLCLGEHNYHKSFFLKTILSLIVSYFFNRFIFSKKSNWIIDYSKCIFCGECQELCPTKNILVKKKKQKVVFSDNCLFCTRCYNFCPQKAINFKKTKDEAVLQYNYFKKDFLKK